MAGLRTMTLMFTDVEGSTRLVQRLGAAWGDVLEQHQVVVRAELAAFGGEEVDTEGDAFFAVFEDASSAVQCATSIHERLAGHAWPEDAHVRVRIGLHTGLVEEREGRYLGLDVHTAARIGACAHGGQTVISETTRLIVGAQDAVTLDLGVHKLKDLPLPVRLHQLGRGAFPPPRTPDARVLVLPPRSGSELRGRESDLERLSRLWESGARLVTVLGPAGVGKTSFALAAAHRQVEAGGHDVVHVSLESVTLSDAVIPAVLRAVGVDSAEDLAGTLGSRPALLVLDNTEQIPAGGDSVSELLRCIEPLRVLVTAQAPLRIPAERLLPLGPLGLPDGTGLADLLESPAGALLCEQIRSVDPAFEPTAGTAEVLAKICRRLDGNPLALELAAGRARTLTPDQLLTRLDDALGLLRRRGAGGRHDSLLAALEWTVSLLSKEAELLFRGLGVFEGGFTVELVEDVAASFLDDPAWELEELMTLSLVRRAGSDRLEFLPSVRDLARRRLAESPDAEEGWHDAHADVMQALTSSAQVCEAANVWAAVRWMRERDPLRHAELVVQCEPILNTITVGAAEDELSAAVHTASRGEDHLLLGRLLALHAGTLFHADRGVDTLAAREQAEAAFAQTHDVEERAHNLIDWALHSHAQERESAFGLLDRADRLLADAGFPPATLSVLVRAQILVSLGDTDGCREALGHLRHLSGSHVLPPDDEQYVAHLEADCLLLLGDYEAARVRYGDSLRVALQRHDLGQAANELQGMSMSLGAVHRFEEALRLLGAAARIRSDFGLQGKYQWWEDLQDRFVLAPATAALGQEEREHCFSTGRELAPEQGTALGLTLSV
jgi:predicted ATPase/class 3 adenylate cyclase